MQKADLMAGSAAHSVLFPAALWPLGEDLVLMTLIKSKQWLRDIEAH